MITVTNNGFDPCPWIIGDTMCPDGELALTDDEMAELHQKVGAALAGRALVSSPDATGCVMNPEVLPDPRSAAA